MNKSINLDEAQATLKDLIHQLAPGDEVIITENQVPVATLVGRPSNRRKPRQPGNCVGMIRIVAEDDEHLSDFEDYR